MNLHDIAYQLRKLPWLKRHLKNLYQYVGNIISDKQTNTAYALYQLSDSGSEHLFGYYDKSPWNKSETKMVYLAVCNAAKQVAPKEKANIILHDLVKNEKKVIAQTSTWNIQQGCMLQWLGNSDDTIIFNDIQNKKFIARILNIETMQEQIIEAPIYSLSKDGKTALTLDFARLHRLRPGYGYSNIADLSETQKLPSGYCIWNIDIETKKISGILTYQQLYDFQYDESMKDAEHKVNHIMINPSGNRLMFLHRWIHKGIKKTRLLTVDIDGNNLYCLLNEDMVSHCNWKDDNTILCWAHKNDIGNHYYLLTDQSSEFQIIAPQELTVDGHPSYSPDGKYFITDTYPNFHRKQFLYLYDVNTKKVTELAAVHANIKYRNDCRCDLHPRWNHSGTKICFDAAKDDRRQVYMIDLKEKV